MNGTFIQEIVHEWDIHPMIMVGAEGNRTRPRLAPG
jgi:hypothetical protein